MPIPLSFPDWVPWWVQLLVFVALILLGIAFAIMPFSVIGTKSRLDLIEARLDEIQGEIRNLALRLPEPVRGSGFDDAPVLRAQPPIPPAPRSAERGRAEPRLDPPLRRR